MIIMGRLIAFEFITLNGYYKGEHEDISWHKHGQEEAVFSADKLRNSENILLFGRVTFEMMASFWPTSMAAEQFPEVAKEMNNIEKIVFSRTLKTTNWQHSSIIGKDMIGHVKSLKDTSSKSMTLLGSGSILTQLASENLVDEYQIMIDPVAIGSGTPLFQNIKRHLDLKLVKSKVFNSGVILLCYEPA